MLSRTFLGDRLSASLRVQYDQLLINDRFEPELSPEASLAIGLVDPLRLVFTTAEVGYDGRDDALSPRQGFHALLRVEAGSPSGGLSTYLRVTPELRGYWPLLRRLVVAGRARLGTKVAGDGALPITRRYYGGGPDSQRGFGRRRLSPAVRRGDGEVLPVGGEVLFESNAELRLDLFRALGQWVGVVGFLDGADVTTRFGDLDLLNLHWAAGGGARWKTPVGSIRLDLGFRLNRMTVSDPDPDGSWALHFSLGEAF